MKTRERKLRCVYVAADYVSTLAGVMLFTLVRFAVIGKLQHIYSGVWPFINSGGSRLTLALFPVMMIGIYYLSGYYVNVLNKSRIREFLSSVSSVAVGAVIFFMAVLLNDVLPSRISNYELLLAFFVCQFIPVYGSRLLLTTFITSYLRSQDGPMRLVAISNGRDDTGQHEALARKSYKAVAGSINVNVGQEDTSISSSLFADALRRYDARGFMLSLSSFPQDELLKIICELYPLERPVFVTPDDYRILTSKVVYDNLLSEPLVDISRSTLSDSVVAMKRCMDVVGAVCGLIVTLPVMAALAIAVKLDSRGPVFYSQERIGWHRRPFRIYKLRSMRTDAESTGPALSDVNDPRITGVGRFMRKYRLDELPNLWNVLRGDMSIVGPRPEREYYLRRMREVAPYCTLLHQVRPGLTSLGMVKYGYATSVDEMLQRLKYDLLYIQNLSLSLDLKIMFHTVRTIFKGEGM